MTNTKVPQRNQLRKSSTYDDTITPSLANYETNSTDLQYDMNALRSAVQNFLNRNGASFPAGDWYTDLAAPTVFTSDPNASTTIRGINALNNSLWGSQRQRFLDWNLMVAISVTGPAANQFVILGAAELPSNTTAAVGAATTTGTVVAFNATFGTATLAEVAGPNALQPKNLVNLLDLSTGEPVIGAVSGEVIYGLLQSESNTNGFTISSSTPNRVQITFVKKNSGNTDLELATAGDLNGINFNYAYIERYAFEDLPESWGLGNGFADTGVSSVSREFVYENQGAAPFTTDSNATLDIGSGFIWEIGNSASNALFLVTEAGASSTLALGTALTSFTSNAATNVFTDGLTADTSDPIHIGNATSGVDTIQFTGNATIESTSGNSLSLETTSAAINLTTTTGGAITASAVGTISLTSTAGDVTAQTATGLATGGTFSATTGTGTIAGGPLNLVTGNGATNGAGGAMALSTGDGAGTGAGGAFSITGGDSGAGATGNGGAVSITAGNAASTLGNGGNIVYTAGARTSTGLFGVNRFTVSGADHLQPIIELQNTANSVQLFTGTASPNGVVTGLAGSLYLQDNGASSGLWVNTSVTSGTTWTLQSAAGATNLQTAYEAGNTIVTTALDGAFDVSGTQAISLDAGAASNFTVASANLTLSTTTAGSVIVDSAGLMDMNAGANLDIDVTGTFDMLSSGVFSIDGTGASNVTATSGNLTVSTVTSGDVVVSSAAVVDVDGTSVTIDASAGGVSIDATGASNFTSTTGGVTIATTTSGGIALTSIGTIDADAVGALSLNSSGAAINIGNDADAFAINIGTGAAARSVTMGNATGATSVNLDSGTGGFTFDSTVAGTVAFATVTTSGTDGDSVSWFVADVDPSAGGGVAAPVGSMLWRDSAGAGTTGQAWLKVGAANTAWEQFRTGTSGSDNLDQVVTAQGGTAFTAGAFNTQWGLTDGQFLEFGDSANVGIFTIAPLAAGDEVTVALAETATGALFKVTDGTNTLVEVSASTTGDSVTFANLATLSSTTTSTTTITSGGLFTLETADQATASSIAVQGGDSTAGAANGGAITLTSGAGDTTGNSGIINIRTAAGNDAAGAASGAVAIRTGASGDAAGATSGDISIRTGSTGLGPTVEAASGDLGLSTGTAFAAASGAISIATGATTGGGGAGNIDILGGSSDGDSGDFGSGVGNINIIASSNSGTADAGNITVTAGENSGTGGLAGALNLRSGDKTTVAGPGGDLKLTGGSGFSTGLGGELTFTGGEGGATAAGGLVALVGGAGGATSGAGGAVTVTGGTPTLGAGGGVTLTGAAAVGGNNNGGVITLVPGLNSGTGIAGHVHIDSSVPDTGILVRLDNSGGANGATINLFTGSRATPETFITGDRGDHYYSDDGSVGRMFLKATGTGSTGWAQVMTTTAAAPRQFAQVVVNTTITGAAAEAGSTNLTQAKCSTGTMPTRASGHTFATQSEIYFNGVLMMNGTGNDVMEATIGATTVDLHLLNGTELVSGDIVTITYYNI